MFKLSVDLGGSTIRSKKGKDGTVLRLDSQFERIPLSARVFNEDIEDKHSDYTILEAPRKDITNARYTRGEATNFLRGVSSQVDNNTLKVDQPETYINATHIMAIAAEKCGDAVPEIVVGACIPASEFFSAGSDRIKEQMEGRYEVKFNLLNKTVEFIVKRVVVYPEGVIAMGDLFKDSKLANIIRTKTGIIIDGGRRSTEVAIIKNGKPLALGARSLPIGGINLEAITAIKLENAGFMASGESLYKAIECGYLIDGDKTVDVGAYIQDAKKTLGGSISKGITEVLAVQTMQLRELSYVVYLGRCFNIAGEGTSRFTGDLGNNIIEELGTSITRISVQSNELANVNAVAEALERIAI